MRAGMAAGSTIWYIRQNRICARSSCQCTDADRWQYDKHYELYRRISPVGNYSGDLHEFLVTPQNTALMTMYDRVPADLTAYGIHAEEESYIYDCLFQEIDLETNELLFEWRASDHFIFDDCYNPPRASNLNINSSSIRPIPIPTHPTSNTSSSPLPLPITKPRAWDWFHINSVSKDHLGNYLISSRYSHSLAYISHSTGEILWQLGGKHNSFIDISPPPYTNLSTSLAWQHHASIVPLNISSIASDDKITTILVFNNDAVNWNRTIPATVLKILLNTTTSPPTSLILAAAEHPQGYIVPSQGSAQQLANGNLFVGYGYAAAMTEYSPDGKEIVCDWQYGALHAKADGAYSAGMVQSYRASKESWKGWPKGLPRVKIEEIEVGVKPKNGSKEEEAHSQPATLKHTTKATQMWISWNGATEVETWTVERRTIFENEFENEDEDLLDLGITTDMLEREHDSSSSSSAEDYRLNASGWLFVKSTKKGGFESNIVIPDLSCELETSEDEGEKNYQQSSKNRTEFRLRAMDSNNQILGLWHVSHEDVVSALPYQQDEGDIAIGRLSLAFGHSAEGYSLRYVLAWMLGLAICLLLVWLWHRRSVVKLPLTEDEGDAHLGLLYDMDDENVKNDVLLKDLF